MNTPIDKTEIENAIEEINGVIMDFTEAINSLIGVKNLLYRLLENDAEKEKRAGQGGTRTLLLPGRVKGDLWLVDQRGKLYLINAPDVRRFSFPGMFFILRKRA